MRNPKDSGAGAEKTARRSLLEPVVVAMSSRIMGSPTTPLYTTPPRFLLN